MFWARATLIPALALPISFDGNGSSIAPVWKTILSKCHSCLEWQANGILVAKLVIMPFCLFAAERLYDRRRAQHQASSTECSTSIHRYDGGFAAELPHGEHAVVEFAPQGFPANRKNWLGQMPVLQRRIHTEALGLDP